MKPLLLALSVIAVTAEHGAAQAPNPVVVIDTSMGTIKLELYADKAPLTVKNVLEYVEDRFYDNTLFHRVYRDFYIQGGGHEPGLKEKKTRPPVKSESGNGLKNTRGMVGLGRSSTAVFYINVADNAYIDQMQPPYTVFGKVIAGMEVADKIRGVAVAQRDKFDAVPVEDVLIRSIRLASHFKLVMPGDATISIGKAFTITAHVEYPVRGQTLTLELPPGMERVEGKEIQPVALVPDSSETFVTWRVRGRQPGEYECVVRSSTGLAQSAKVKLTEAGK